MKKILSFMMALMIVSSVFNVYAQTDETAYMRAENCYQSEEQRAFVSDKVSEIIDELGIETKDRYNQITAINEWLKKNVTYDHQEWKKNITSRRTAYSALTDGVTVCSGYIQLGREFCQQLDIPSDYVRVMDGNDAHGVLMVQMEDGKYYYWDPTNDRCLIGAETLGMKALTSTSYYNNGKNKVSDKSYVDQYNPKLQLTQKECEENEAIKNLCLLLDKWYEEDLNFHSSLIDTIDGDYAYYSLTDAQYKSVVELRYIKSGHSEVV